MLTSSRTALITAFVRAYHARHATSPLFDDALAHDLFADGERAALASNLARALPLVDARLDATRPDEARALAVVLREQSTPIVVSRARYTEDQLEAAVARGVTQYLILGAGFDTFAYRRPDLLQRLRVLEVDHPATQEDKQRRVARAGWLDPAALHRIPADFSRDALRSVLVHAPFDPRAPTFVSWLGVTYYLSSEAVLAALRAVASLLSPGSVVVFDHLDRSAFDPVAAAPRIRVMRAFVENVGEPMISAFEPSRLAMDLRDAGLRLVEHWSPSDLQARYFEGRSDGLRAFEHMWIARAEVY